MQRPLARSSLETDTHQTNTRGTLGLTAPTWDQQDICPVGQGDSVFDPSPENGQNRRVCHRPHRTPLNLDAATPLPSLRARRRSEAGVPTGGHVPRETRHRLPREVFTVRDAGQLPAPSHPGLSSRVSLSSLSDLFVFSSLSILS